MGTLDDDTSNEFFDSIFKECLMWVWVYKGVLDFSLRLKLKRCIEIFLDTYFVLLGIFLDFQREYLSTIVIVWLPRK